jgi:hypothetical protein
VMPRWRDDFQGQDGIAMPTAMLAMMIMLMLGGLFVAYAAPQQRATATSQSFETGLHVAETAVELALASLADPDQVNQPPEASGVPADRAGARAWAISQAQARVSAGCPNFERTAGGDGIAIVSTDDGAVYGVGFLPNCENPRTTRVLRVSYATRPLVPLPASYTFLTGGDIYFDHANSKLGTGGIHSNGNIYGQPNVDAGTNFTASGTCTAPTCVGGQPVVNIPNLTARSFWNVRNEPAINPQNVPFYELCGDGTVRTSAADAGEPCQGPTMAPPGTGWVFTSGSHERTWTWDRNSPPPDGIYYAYQANIINRSNSGHANGVTFLAEASTTQMMSGQGKHSGSITFARNLSFMPAWPGIGAVADVDVIFLQNPQAQGQMTVIFAREQLRVQFNGKYDRFMFIACDQSKRSSQYDPEAPHCVADPSARSTTHSPIDLTRITQNAEFDAPATGSALIPNLGITGVGDWEVL